MKVSTRAPGRPRALTIAQILDAAIGHGLTNISMPALAAKLGIATATLYNYVANREELVRLAALRAGTRPVTDDLEQDWRDYVRDHAKQFFKFWVSEPQLLAQYTTGIIGPEDLLEYMESFLAAMRRRGFSANGAYQLLSAVNTTVLGGVARARHLAALLERGESYSARIRRSLREREQLPNVRACIKFIDEGNVYNLNEAVERVIEHYADINSRRDR
jgi:AcrR family transcriptional regulator